MGFLTYPVCIDIPTGMMVPHQYDRQVGSMVQCLARGPKRAHSAVSTTMRRVTDCRFRMRTVSIHAIEDVFVDGDERTDIGIDGPGNGGDGPGIDQTGRHQRSKGIEVGVSMGGDDLGDKSVSGSSGGSDEDGQGWTLAVLSGTIPLLVRNGWCPPDTPLKGSIQLQRKNRGETCIPGPAGAFRFPCGFRCSFWPADNEDRRSRARCPPPPPPA
jgi:hypothetical protein